jgi:hypothetical protein
MKYGTNLKLTDHLDRDLHMRVEKSGVITVQLDDHDELSVIELTPRQVVELRDYLSEMILAYLCSQPAPGNGDFRAARGILPTGDEPSEVTIRRMRDEE